MAGSMILTFRKALLDTKLTTASASVACSALSSMATIPATSRAAKGPLHEAFEVYFSLYLFILDAVVGVEWNSDGALTLLVIN